MLNIYRKLILLFAITFFVQNLLFEVLVAAESCPKRTDYDSTCKKQCTSDKNCKTRQNRVKKCLCDGVCGLSCIRVGQMCREESTVVTKLKKGFVKLNGQPYQKRTFKFGDEISYTCNNGFTLYGPSKIVCSGIGKWKPWDQGKPSCNKKKCKSPGVPKNGRMIGNNFKIGKVVRFRCNSGYIRKGAGSLTCMPNLQWNRQKPKCKAVDCGKPDITNAIFDETAKTKFGSSLKIACLKGSILHGKDNINCQENGDWSNLPECRVLTCKDPQIPENGRISKRKQFSYRYGDLVFFSCNSGYSRIGNPAVICDKNGWKSRGKSFPKCAPKNCGHPGYIRNGKVEGTVFTYKSIVKFTCDKGYEMTRGNAYRRCTENQRWSGDLPYCEPNCEDPGTPYNGQKIGNSFFGGDMIEFKCDDGYEMNGEARITCHQFNARWSHPIPQCKPVDCGKPKISNSIFDETAKTTFQSSLKISCKEGFILSGKDDITCQENGVWSSLPECRAVDCGKPVVANGIFDETAKTTFQSSLKISCKKGFILSGEDDITCQENGAWSSLPECSAVDCGKPVVANGIFDETAKTTFQSSLKISCKEGFILSGKDDITCQDNGVWSSLPECSRDLANGNIVTAKTSLNVDNMHRYKSEIAYVCNKGFELNSEKVSICEKDGWTGCVRTCTKIKTTDGPCDLPLGMKNSDIKDEQISFQTYSRYHINTKGRFDGKEWCGSFTKYHGEVSAQIKFNSVVQIKKVSFQKSQYPQKYEVTKVVFRYYDAEDKNHVFKATPKHNKRYDVNLRTNSVFDVTLDEPIKSSYFEIVFFQNGGPTEYVCSKFEIYGCNEPSTCGIPKSPISGEALGMIYRNGDQAVYSCNSGFKLENDNKQICSSTGKWTGDIPKCVKESNYLGCYKDGHTRVLSQWRGSYFSPEECQISCKNIYNIQVAGIQYSSQCRCGYENKLHSQKTDDRECYIPCNKDVSRKCGGPWRNSVYRI